MAGDWKQRELWDGSYIFADLVDWHEMAAVKAENTYRIQACMNPKETS